MRTWIISYFFILVSRALRFFDEIKPSRSGDKNVVNRVLLLTWPFIGTKESVCIRKEFNSQRTGLEHQHGRRFIG